MSLLGGPLQAQILPCPGGSGECLEVEVEAPPGPILRGDAFAVSLSFAPGADDDASGGADDISALTFSLAIPGLELADCSTPTADGITSAITIAAGIAADFRLIVENTVCDDNPARPCLCPGTGQTRAGYVNLAFFGPKALPGQDPGELPTLPAGDLVSLSLRAGTGAAAEVPLHIFAETDSIPKPTFGARISAGDVLSVDVSAAGGVSRIRTIDDVVQIVDPSTPTRTLSPTITTTPSRTATASRTLTPTRTPTVTRTSTATRTATLGPPTTTQTPAPSTATATITPEATNTSSVTPVPTVTSTPEANTATPVPTETQSPPPTDTPGGPTVTPTEEAPATSTSTAVPSPTPTTPSSPTATEAEATATPPEATATPPEPTATPPAPTATPPDTPVPTPLPCAADCDPPDGSVSLAERVEAIEIGLLRRGLGECQAADVNGDLRVTVEEIVAAVIASQGPCP